MTYKPGGKGISPRSDSTPSWVVLEELWRDDHYVRFKTMSGVKMVPLKDVEAFENLNLNRNAS